MEVTSVKKERENRIHDNIKSTVGNQRSKKKSPVRKSISHDFVLPLVEISRNLFFFHRMLSSQYSQDNIHPQILGKQIPLYFCHTCWHQIIYLPNSFSHFPLVTLFLHHISRLKPMIVTVKSFHCYRSST